jgi:hypothetical protein
MPDWTDRNAWMAASWKESWNVDPLPLRVPERLEPPLPPDDGGLLLDEHAARTTAIAATGSPIAARWMR